MKNNICCLDDSSEWLTNYPSEWLADDSRNMSLNLHVEEPASAQMWQKVCSDRKRSNFSLSCSHRFGWLCLFASNGHCCIQAWFDVENQTSHNNPSTGNYCASDMGAFAPILSFSFSSLSSPSWYMALFYSNWALFLYTTHLIHFFFNVSSFYLTLTQIHTLVYLGVRQGSNHQPSG